MADLVVRQERPLTEAEIAHCGRSIPAVFDDIARRNPDALALGGDEPTTYGELSDRVDRVARGVAERLRDGPEPIGLAFTGTRSFLTALLGVLKAGKIAMPLDWRAPPGVLTTTLSNCGAKLLLGDVGALHDQPVVPLEALEAGGSADADYDVGPDSPALLLYTSGSSGEPKGIVTRHGSELHQALMFARQFEAEPGSRMGLVAPLVYAAAYGSIFPALLSGATLFRYATADRGLAGLPAWIENLGINGLMMTSGMVRPLAAATVGQGNLSLRALVLGGELLTPSDAELARTVLAPGGRVVHLYASTEAMATCWHVLDDSPASGETVTPVGRSMPGKIVQLSDVDQGIGEITVTSRYLSHGYWRQGAETARVFLDRPSGGERTYRTGDVGRLDSHGRLIVVGRRDRLVKIRGRRVELDAVERALSKEDAISEVAVIARRRSSGAHTLVAHVVASSGSLDLEAFGRSLQADLPAHMIPDRIVTLVALPRLPNGKVDTQSLADSRSSAPTVPRSAIETALIEIWQEILDTPVGVDDNFFELGGDSLAVVEMVASVEETFGQKLDISDLKAAPTPELLAGLLERRWAGLPTAAPQ